MSKLWTGVGILLTVGMVGLSALINYSFGYSLGTTEMNGRIFGAVSVVAVGVMAVLPLRISNHWDAARKPTAIAGAVVFAILATYAVASSIGFGMQNRSQIANSAEGLRAQLRDQLADRDQAITRLKNLAEDMPASVIATRIDAAKKDRRWLQTDGCTNATAVPSREFCQGVDRLRGQLDVAAEAAVLRDKMEQLNRSIENLRLGGAGQDGDAQSSGLATVFRTEQGTVQMGLSVLLALVIESVCCFGLLVIVGGEERAKDKTLSTPEWFGKWLSERAEPCAGLRAEYWELQADFSTWARDKGAPRLRTWRFRRLLHAACAELKLELDGECVEGLRLLPTNG